MGSGFEQVSRGQRIKFDEKARVQDHQSSRSEVREVTLLQRHGVGRAQRAVRFVG